MAKEELKEGASYSEKWWHEKGTVFREKADEGKIAVVEVLIDYNGFVASVETAAAWHSTYPSGDNVHVVAEMNNKMSNGYIGTNYLPTLALIDENFKWKLPEDGEANDQITSVYEYVKAL